MRQLRKALDNFLGYGCIPGSVIIIWWPFNEGLIFFINDILTYVFMMGLWTMILLFLAYFQETFYEPYGHWKGKKIIWPIKKIIQVGIMIIGLSGIAMIVAFIILLFQLILPFEISDIVQITAVITIVLGLYYSKYLLGYY